MWLYCPQAPTSASPARSLVPRRLRRMCAVPSTRHHSELRTATKGASKAVISHDGRYDHEVFSKQTARSEAGGRGVGERAAS